jgi:multiple sugar transport system permease protein
MTLKDRGYSFILPALFILFLVAVYPLGYMLWLSFQKRLLIFNVSGFVGWGNYLFLLKDARFWNALKNTVYFTAVSTALELLLGLGIALLINRSFKYRGLITAVILVPWAVPTVVSARMWELIYNSDFGVLNYILGARINWLGSPAWAMHAAILADVWKTTPFVILLLVAGLRVIPRELYQAARVDGAGSWGIFRYITLPLLLPVILVALLFRTLDAFRVFDIIYVLTGGGPANTTETLSVYAYKVLFQTLRFGYGSTLAVVVFLCTGAISLVYVKLLVRGRGEG